MNSCGIGPMDCRLERITDIAKVEPVWREMQGRSECSYFLSWSWICTWLRRLPRDLRPMLLTVTAQGAVVGLAVVIEQTLWRHGILRSRAVFLNKTGIDALDEITIEYNGVLAEVHRRQAVQSAAIEFLIAGGWDEVYIDAAQFSDESRRLFGSSWDMRRRNVSQSYGVDIQELRRLGTGYLDALSGNTRYQVRHTLRCYGKLGPLRIEVAQTLDEAKAWFNEMRRLHQIYWTGKGLHGAFANSFLNAFHLELIANRMPHGEIQILRVGFGEQWIGYLYNFLSNGVVLNYQSGFDYSVLPRSNRPGVVTHYAAIEFNREQGMNYYDFLRGGNQNKITLSTVSVPLDDLVARADRLKFRMEDAIRSVRDLLLRLISQGVFRAIARQ